MSKHSLGYLLSERARAQKQVVESTTEQTPQIHSQPIDVIDTSKTNTENTSSEVAGVPEDQVPTNATIGLNSQEMTDKILDSTEDITQH